MDELPSDASSLVISGANCDTVAGSTIVVLLSTIAGPIAGAVKSVSADSSSQLTVTLNTGLLSIGQLYATVQSANVTSDTVYVANVVAAPPSARTSTVDVSSGQVHRGGTVHITVQAKDSLGRDITTGGLEVAFALAPGSAGGTFGSVRDNGDGSYATTFTSSGIGINTILATLNGEQITTTVQTEGVFDFHALVELLRPAVPFTPSISMHQYDRPTRRFLEAGVCSGAGAVYGHVRDDNVLLDGDTAGLGSGLDGRRRSSEMVGPGAGITELESGWTGGKPSKGSVSPRSDRANTQKQHEAATDAVMEEMAEELVPAEADQGSQQAAARQWTRRDLIRPANRVRPRLQRPA